MKIKLNKSGLILTEALLAIAMLSIGSLVLASIVQNAVRTTVLSRNYLIAQNLATEGIEAIKSVRDTNWLLQADEPECWLEMEPDSDGVCAGEMMIVGSYRPQEASGKWYVDNGVMGILDLEDGDDSEYQLYVNNGRYSYNVIGESTIFYRGVNVISLVGTESAVFEIVVEWKEGQKVRSLKRELLLYNFN